MAPALFKAFRTGLTLRNLGICVFLLIMSGVSVSARNRLSPFPSEVQTKSSMAIIVCPGGSYSWRDWNVEGEGVAQWLQQEGIDAYVLRYRVQGGFAFASGIRYLIRGHRHPDPITDLQNAILQVRALGYEKIGVMGFSAGGHLVMSSAYLKSPKIEQTKALRPDFIVPVYPVVTMRQKPYVHKRSRRALLGEYRKHRQSLRDSLSLELHVPVDCPPVFLVNCKDDPIVHYRNSEILDSALTKKHIAHRYLQYETGGHGFGANEQKAGAEASAWKKEFIKWIKTL